MRHLLILVLALTSINAYSQSSPDDYFDTYKDETGFSYVTISSSMLSIANTDEAFIEAIENIDEIRILTAENGAADFDFACKLIENLPSDDYSELMSLNENGEEIVFYAKEDGAVVEELLLLVCSDLENVMISITGDIDLQNIASLANAIGVPEIEELDNL